VAYHLLSRGLAQTTPYKRVGLVAMQVACVVILFQLITSNATGPLLLLLTVAVEVQFLVSLRVALVGALGLWLLALVTIELRIAGAHSHVYALTPQQVLTDGATTLTGFVFVVAFTRSAVTELIQRHQATILLDELNATHAQLQTYVDQVEELTVARERNRMARDIHDTLGHYLTVLNVQIETAQKLSGRDAARSQEALATAKRLASECLAEVRRSVAALRPAALDDVALPEAIGRLVDDLRRGSGLTIHVETHAAGTLSPAVEVTVYRVIQEALTNVRKHAQAQNVWVQIEWDPAWISASVRDDGRGAPSARHHGDSSLSAGFGLQGMGERVSAVGGTLEAHTAPGAGFCVVMRVPRSPVAGDGMTQPSSGQGVSAR
jgi:signal transduction histidine kinase